MTAEIGPDGLDLKSGLNMNQIWAKSGLNLDQIWTIFESFAANFWPIFCTYRGTLTLSGPKKCGPESGRYVRTCHLDSGQNTQFFLPAQILVHMEEKILPSGLQKCGPESGWHFRTCYPDSDKVSPWTSILWTKSGLNLDWVSPTNTLDQFW